MRPKPIFPRWSSTPQSYDELAITGEHAVALHGQPSIPDDSFDCMLIVAIDGRGQHAVDRNPLIAQYPSPIRKVRGRDARRARLSQAQSPVQDRV
jgi:hypothetical protein